MDDNERLARALGLAPARGWVQQVEGEALLTIDEPDRYWDYQSELAWLIVDGDRLRLLPCYTASLDACAEAEREITKRGLRVAYVRALASRIGAAWMLDDPKQRDHALYGLITASPEVRVRAMLDVLH